MTNYLRILQPTEVYTNYQLQSPIIKTLQADELVPYKREKRRNRINWMEICLEDGGLGYIIKKKNNPIEIANFYICDYVKLDDLNITGFNYTINENQIHSNSKMLHWFNIFHNVGDLSPLESEIKTITIQSTQDNKKNKTSLITLEYDAKKVNTTSFEINKDERFYIIYKSLIKNDILMEINDLKGRHGYVLKKSNVTKIKDIVLSRLAIVLVGIAVIALLFFMLRSGYIFLGLLLFIPSIIVGAVLVALVHYLLMIPRGLFYQIRKRF